MKPVEGALAGLDMDVLLGAGRARGYFLVTVWEDVGCPDRALTIRLCEGATTAEMLAGDLDTLRFMLDSWSQSNNSLPLAGRLVALRSCDLTFGSSLTAEMASVLLRRAIYSLQANGLPEGEEWLALADPDYVEPDSWCGTRRFTA